jgi:hypothetical protein
MSIPPQRSRSRKNTDFQFKTFTASVCDTLCVPIITIASILNTFNEANGSLLQDPELDQLIRALSVLSRSGIEFISRHRPPVDVNNNARTFNP